MDAEQLEKWIAGNAEYRQCDLTGNRELMIKADNCRALFDGKVLVPVEDEDEDSPPSPKRVFCIGTLRDGVHHFNVVFLGDKLFPIGMVIDELNSVDVLVNKLRKANKKLKSMLAASQEQKS